MIVAPKNGSSVLFLKNVTCALAREGHGKVGTPRGQRRRQGPDRPRTDEYVVVGKKALAVPQREAVREDLLIQQKGAKPGT